MPDLPEKNFFQAGLPFLFWGINNEIFQQTPKKHKKMKKFFAIALIAATMVACNNSGDKKEGETKDTTAAPAPAPAPDTTATPAPDTTAAPAPAVDTTKK